MGEASTHLLDYDDKRMRAMSSRSYRTKQPAVNGNQFVSGGSVIQFDIPANQARTFLDMEASYILVEVENLATVPTGSVSFESKNGIYAMIDKVECLSAGQTLFTVDKYGVLQSVISGMETNTLYGANQGEVLQGSGGGAYTGVALIAGAKRTVAIPLQLNGLYNANKYIPLFSRDKLSFRITLADARVGVISTDVGATTTANGLRFNNPEFVCHQVELGSDAMEAVGGAVDYQFDLVSTDYRHTSAVLATGATSAVVNLGFAFSSCNKIISTMRTSTLIAGDTARKVASIGSRNKNGLTNACVLLNGAKIPQREIMASNTNIAETMAELLVAQGSLASMAHSSRINDGGGFGMNTATGVNAGNVGSFVSVIGLENMRSDSDGLYSGVSSIGSVLQLELGFASGANGILAPNTLDVFCEYTSQYSLNMLGEQLFQVSV
jgi:hypothetical protein